MGSRQHLKIEKPADYESIFLDHYAWLLHCAVQVTRDSREEAEDLVQDLYVRFVLSQPAIDVSDSERMRGYLYRALQNLMNDRHRSRVRDPLSSLQTVDFDSMETALATADRSRLLYIRSELFRICEYACSRREDSRAASALILRFFLAYLPSEIAALFKSSPAAVHKLVETARLEAKSFLTRPGLLHFMGQDSRARTRFAKVSLPDDPTDLFARLRCRIFADKVGECFSSDRLELLYSRGSEQQPTTREAAHLVSCRICLERANHLLHFPKHSNRYPDDFNGRSDNDLPSSSRGSRQRQVDKMREKLRAVREHRPKTLEIAVDGHVRGAQHVTSALSRFHIPMKASSKPKYITVLSEQGYGLLYLDLQHQDASEFSPLRTEIGLSDDRSLVLELNPSGNGSVIGLTYYDPALDSENQSWLLAVDPSLTSDAELEHKDKTQGRRGRLARLWQTCSAWHINSDHLLPVSVGIAVVLISVLAVNFPSLFTVGRDSHAIPTATSLLAQSERVAKIAIPIGGASRQTFDLEVRDTGGRLLEKATVQTLHGNTPERQATRLISQNHQLLGGRWIDSNGKLSTYSPRTGLRHSNSVPSGPAATDEAWTRVPDAAEFDRMARKQDSIRVEPQQNGYELIYNEPSSTSLVYADLVLTGKDLHPTFETLRLKEGKSTREYRFRELSYEVLRSDQTIENDFEPDALFSDPRSSGSIRPDGQGSSAHLALEALLLLSNLGPDVERIVDLERRSDGTIELNGVFPTSAEKTSVAGVFRSLQADRQLKLDLHASDEPPLSVAKARAVQVDSLSPIAIDTQLIPFDSDIRHVYARQGLAGEQLEERVKQTASSAVSHSSQLHRGAWSICAIAARDFTPEELQAMAPDDQVLWLSLLEGHIRTFENEFIALRTELAPFEGENRARYRDSPDAPPPFHNVGELQEAAIILNHDSARLDRLVTTGFTLSPSNLPTKYNFAEITQLMTDLNTEEKTLRGTLERLRMFGQAGTEK